MAERTWIEQTVEKAVSLALDSQLPQLRQELVARVLQEVQPHVNGSSNGAGNGSSGEFLKAVSSIHSGSTQREILRALLDNTVRYSGRAVLFVVKSGAGTGWQGRGISNPDAIKDFALDVNAGLAGRAMQSRMPFAGSAAEMEGRFISQFGTPADGQAIVLPLLLKDKVAALIYADAGVDPGGKLDAAALELLVVSASAWLEVAALRKQAHRDGASTDSGIAKAEPVSTMKAQAPSFSDPFAAQAPAYAMAAPAVAMPGPAPAEPSSWDTASAEPASAESGFAESTLSEPEFTAANAASGSEEEPAAFAAAAGAGEMVSASPAAETGSGMSAEDAEVHRKAQRFARLLVDEIKLYNQAKVVEGRKSKDIYSRLRDDIDKSQATYAKRYGNTVAGSANYFDLELIRSIAEDDPSVMGPDFRR